MRVASVRIDTWLWRLFALIAALAVALPILVLFLQWFALGNGEQRIWQHLLETNLLRLAINTLVLLAGVALGVGVLGVTLAALTTLCEFPGRRFFEWALLLPLAIPGYVMAFVFLGLFSFAGPAQTLARTWFGSSSWFPDVQSPLFVIVALSLVLYPYVYLMARTAFLSQGRNLIEAARTLGLSPISAFLRVVLPVARPAMAGGIALVLMETLADFGAVSVFNYDTFTTAIYKAWYGLFNPAVAAQLATLLLTFVLITMVLEHYSRKGARFGRDERSRAIQRYHLHGTHAVLACTVAGGVLAFAFVMPVAQLVLWVFEAGAAEYDDRYPEFLGHSLSLATIAAVVAVALSVLLSVVQRLAGSKPVRMLQQFSTRIATLGYALPGSVLAVGILQIFTTLSLMTSLALTGTVTALVLAYLTRFLAVAHSPVEAAMERIRPSLIEAARGFGVQGTNLVSRLYVPLLWPGLATAALLVFVDVMKEMPATLIVRPFGWDTLAVRVFQMTAEGQWQRAALPALTLLIAGLVPVTLLLRSAGRASGPQ